MTDVFEPGALARLERQIDEWLGGFRAANSAIEAVDRGEGDEVRWYVRMRGEQKEYTTVWLTLGQRTLRLRGKSLAGCRQVFRRAGVVWHHGILWRRLNRTAPHPHI